MPILSLLIVLSCIFSGLSQIDKSEVKTEVSSIESPLADLTWCTFENAEILLLLSESGSIYRSSDKGFSW